jgi:putative DNA primase/helicase
VTESQRPLLLAWLCFNLAHPNVPHPLLFISGSQGFGKSTVTRMIAELIDPNSMSVNAELPKAGRDLRALVNDVHVVIFDNVKYLKDDMSNLLCCLATGASLKTRRLHTDQDLSGIKELRPVVMNGIADVIKAPDLLERTLFVEIEKAERRTRETKLWAEFEACRGSVLGCLLDGVAAALAGEDRDTEEDWRMADFAAFGAAAVTAFGYSSKDFEDVYRESEAHGHDVIKDSSAVFTAIVDLAKSARTKDPGYWSGDMTQLFDELEKTGAKYRPGFPKNAIGLSSAIRRIQPALKREDVVIEKAKDKDPKTRRAIQIVRYTGSVDSIADHRADDDIPF